MTIPEAFEKYHATEDAASKEYHEFWLEKFKAAGIIFSATGNQWWHPYKAVFNGYEIDAYTNPGRYTGIKLKIFPMNFNGRLPYHSIKVKSETGFSRVIRRLHNKDYK